MRLNTGGNAPPGKPLLCRASFAGTGPAASTEYLTQNRMSNNCRLRGKNCGDCRELEAAGGRKRAFFRRRRWGGRHQTGWRRTNLCCARCHLNALPMAGPMQFMSLTVAERKRAGIPCSKQRESRLCAWKKLYVWTTPFPISGGAAEDAPQQGFPC